MGQQRGLHESQCLTRFGCCQLLQHATCGPLRSSVLSNDRKPARRCLRGSGAGLLDLIAIALLTLPLTGGRLLALNARPGLATGMPERDDFKVLSSRTAVDEVAGSRQVQAARFRVPRIFHKGADAWLLNQCFECALQVRANGSWRTKAIFAPPSSGGFNLPLSPWLDTNKQRQAQPYFCSFSRSSAPEIPSSRSASSSASSSSA